jgi:hypothetical protein
MHPRRACAAVLMSLMLWLGLASGQASEAEDCATVLPLQPFRRLIVVPVQIGGSPSLDFVLDSGSASTTLNDVFLANTLGLHARPLGPARGFADTRIPVLSAPDVPIRAGAKELMRVNLLIHHVIELQEEVAGRDLHGLLGADLFSRYAVEIDPDLAVAVLHPPGTPVPFAPLAEVPIEVHRGRPLVVVEVTLAGSRPATVRLLLDTGSEAALVLVRGAHRRLEPQEGASEVRITGIGGQTRAALAPVDRLVMGDLEVASTEAAFVERSDLPTTRELRRVDGVLGNGLLHRYHTWIDLRAGRLALGERDAERLPTTPR